MQHLSMKRSIQAHSPVQRVKPLHRHPLAQRCRPVCDQHASRGSCAAVTDAAASLAKRGVLLLGGVAGLSAMCPLTTTTVAAAAASSEPPSPPSSSSPRPVPTVPYADPGGVFRLQLPKGWSQVKLLPGTGVLASWYDPNNRGSDIVAVYAAGTAAADTPQLGTAQAVGAALAAVAPGGQLQRWSSDRRTKGRQYITTQVQFSGVSAGLFGAVVDVRCSVVAKGKVYTLRVASKAANIAGNPAWYQAINKIVESFQVLV